MQRPRQPLQGETGGSRTVKERRELGGGRTKSEAKCVEIEERSRRGREEFESER